MVLTVRVDQINLCIRQSDLKLNLLIELPVTLLLNRMIGLDQRVGRKTAPPAIKMQRNEGKKVLKIRAFVIHCITLV